MKFLVIILIAIFPAMPAFGAMEPGNVFGVWLTEGGDSKLEIFPCGDKACAKVIWLKHPAYINSKDGPVGMDKVDMHNPDPSLRSRPILGLQVMEGLISEGEWWLHGSCYDPQTGKQYQCKMHQESPTELKLRGFIGISLIGRTYYLNRDLSDPVRTAQNRESKSRLH
jgi:uncharacterized protein (DUF2147 family)